MKKSLLYFLFGEEKTKLVNNLPTVLQNWIKIPENRMPNDFEKLIKTLENDEIDTSYRNFKYAEERLFTTMSILEKDVGKIQHNEFLHRIFELDQRLTSIFNAIPIKNAEDQGKIKRIKDILGSKTNKKVRNLVAKALLLDVFTRLDEAPGSVVNKMLDKDSVFLCKGYGQMARFLKQYSRTRT